MRGDYNLETPMILLFVLFLSTSPFASPQDASACATWQACRDLAQQAADRHDYEAFHDLAWRAVQKGPRNDTTLMTMLARAQSLSGRPHDALVMLQRIAALGGSTDAGTSEDFQRVRALPGWAEFERSAAEAPGASAAAAPAEPAPTKSDVAPPAGPPSATGRAPGRGRRVAPHEDAAAAASPGDASAADAPSGDAAEAMRFTTAAFTPAGLAYDAVSDRYIVGDREARKLTVVDEASRRVANLAGAQSAGFGDVAALEIDPREGDLWVVSSDPERRTATLHKLQLVSGRVLYALPLDETYGEARFADVAVTPHSTILALDAAARRVFRAQPKSRNLELAMSFDEDAPRSIAPESDTVAYVACANRVVRLDLGARRARALAAPAGVDLSGFRRLRWHRDSLVGIQETADGTFRVVRLRLDSTGHRVRSADVLDRNLRMTDPTAAALSGDTFYYLSETGTFGGIAVDTIVKRLTIK